jgi:hypothetical protein
LKWKGIDVAKRCGIGGILGVETKEFKTCIQQQHNTLMIGFENCLILEI